MRCLKAAERHGSLLNTMTPGKCCTASTASLLRFCRVHVVQLMGEAVS